MVMVEGRWLHPLVTTGLFHKLIHIFYLYQLKTTERQHHSRANLVDNATYGSPGVPIIKTIPKSTPVFLIFLIEGLLQRGMFWDLISRLEVFCAN